MARRIPRRFSVVGLSIVAALLVVWPVPAQGVGTSYAAQSAAQPSEATDFTSFWVQTFTPTTAWAGSDADAQALGKIQMWRYLEVVGPSDGNRWPVVDPRTQARSWVDASAVGPVGPPPEEYFADTPPDDVALNVPGRIIGSTELFERPRNERYFAQEQVYTNTPITVQGAVDTDSGRWYHLSDDQYVPQNRVRIPTPPGRSYPGRWIDANLSEPVMVTAYEDDRPVYSALAVKGTAAFQTPTGVYRIQRRVANETMDSATLGIPRTSPNGYYLKDVLYTQYFTGDGAALHYNYWRANWGYAGSHGCLGMNYDDSLFFWNFASVGTIVYVHS
jgi:lipoprotein-anchoring transpeptidase ErfK/SrfK